MMSCYVPALMRFFIVAVKNICCTQCEFKALQFAFVFPSFLLLALLYFFQSVARLDCHFISATPTTKTVLDKTLGIYASKILLHREDFINVKFQANLMNFMMFLV